jgi:hypothetical protein
VRCDRHSRIHLRTGAQIGTRFQYGCGLAGKRSPGRELFLRDISVLAEHRGGVLGHEQRQLGGGCVARIGQGDEAAIGLGKARLLERGHGVGLQLVAKGCRLGLRGRGNVLARRPRRALIECRYQRAQDLDGIADRATQRC